MIDQNVCKIYRQNGSEQDMFKNLDTQDLMKSQSK